MDAKPDLQPDDVPVGPPFGEKNRKRLIKKFFAAHGLPEARSAWQSVYRMLLWADRTTGLAHCYESDKSQPGRAWYARSLAFHEWLSMMMGTTPKDLGSALDWLFRAAIKDSLKQLARQQSRHRETAARQRAAYAGRDFPLPGLDPEVRNILLEHLSPHFTTTPSETLFEVISERLREYWRQENKRKNLLGEGFEDVLAHAIRVVLGGKIQARTRASIADVKGFYSPGAKDKATKVDLVVEHPAWPHPALVNVKWSIRADREDQLWDDFKEYVRFDRDHHGFSHYLVTNEFDPARLNAVCDRREANNYVFKQVVHISTEGLRVTYGQMQPPKHAGVRSVKKVARDSIFRVNQQIHGGRLIDLAKWLELLGSS